MLTKKRTGLSFIAFSVELPGIEPAPKMAVTCGNAGLGYAKVREMTCGYAKRVDDINTACGHPRRAAHRRVNEGQEQLCIA